MENKHSHVDTILHAVAGEQTLGFANTLKPLLPSIMNMTLSLQWSPMSVVPKYKENSPRQRLFVIVRFKSQAHNQIAHTVRQAHFANNQYHADVATNPNTNPAMYWEIIYESDDAKIIQTSPCEVVAWHYPPDMYEVDFYKLTGMYPTNPLVLHSQPPVQQQAQPTVSHQPVKAPASLSPMALVQQAQRSVNRPVTPVRHHPQKPLSSSFNYSVSSPATNIKNATTESKMPDASQVEPVAPVEYETPLPEQIGNVRFLRWLVGGGFVVSASVVGLCEINTPVSKTLTGYVNEGFFQSLVLACFVIFILLCFSLSGLKKRDKKENQPRRFKTANSSTH